MIPLHGSKLINMPMYKYAYNVLVKTLAKKKNYALQLFT